MTICSTGKSEQILEAGFYRLFLNYLLSIGVNSTLSPYGMMTLLNKVYQFVIFKFNFGLKSLKSINNNGLFFLLMEANHFIKDMRMCDLEGNF